MDNIDRRHRRRCRCRRRRRRRRHGPCEVPGVPLRIIGGHLGGHWAPFGGSKEGGMRSRHIMLGVHGVIERVC